MEHLSFNEKWRRRTKKLAVDLIRMYSKMKKTDEVRIIGKQLLRSATSVAANFRAYCRGRSQREQFAKLCIVVEEADETLFWLEVLEDTGLCTAATLNPFKAEALEILKMMSNTRKRLKN
ncbi:MAG: four helix bundle protein [bacterium]|nr:four helix bundle protein [bacterium]